MEQLSANKWEFLYTQWGDSLLHYVVAIVVGWGVLKVLDWMAGVNFKQDVVGELNSGNQAWAHYLGLRFLGICILGYAFIK